MFHYDTARPHTFLTPQRKLASLGWDVVPHPPYSLNLAPSDNNLFRSLQNSLNGKTFTDKEGIKNKKISQCSPVQTTVYCHPNFASFTVSTNANDITEALEKNNILFYKSR